MIRIIGIISALVVFALRANAGSVTDTNRAIIGSVEKISLNWSTGTNDASAATGNVPLSGVLNRVVIHKTTSTTAATYSVTMTDAAGVDLLNGLMTAAATGTIYSFAPAMALTLNAGVTTCIPRSVYDVASVVITNCGSNASGRITLYVSP